MRKSTFSFAARFGVTVAAALLAGSMGVQAQTLGVQPVNIQLAPGEESASLTIINQGEQETSYQLRAFDWKVQNGDDQLTQTDAVVASPPLGTIAPGGKQLVRLVLRRNPQSAESTYRIWLDQIPPAAQPGSVRIALRFSIPVFAEPAGRIASDVKWRLVRENGGIYLVGDNAGLRHQTVRDLVLTDAAGHAVVTDGNVSPHILAGSFRRWHVAGSPPNGQLHLTAKTDEGSIDQFVPISAP